LTLHKENAILLLNENIIQDRGCVIHK